MWTGFIGRLALFVSVLFTLAGIVEFTLRLVEYYKGSTPLDILVGVSVYIGGWFIGVILIYAVAWVLCGKNVFPGRG